MSNAMPQLTLFTKGDFHDQDAEVLDAFFGVRSEPELSLAFWPHPGPDRGYPEDAEAELRDEMASYGLRHFPSWGLLHPDGQRVGCETLNTPSMLIAWLQKNSVLARHSTTTADGGAAP